MELRSVETIIRALNTAKVQYLVVGGIYEPFNFAEEMSYSITVEIESDLFVPVVSLDTLLVMKRAAGRPQDLVDITELQRAP